MDNQEANIEFIADVLARNNPTEMEELWRNQIQSNNLEKATRPDVSGKEFAGMLSWAYQETGDASFLAALSAIYKNNIVSRDTDEILKNRKNNDQQMLEQHTITMVNEFIASGIIPAVAFREAAIIGKVEANSYSAAVKKVERLYRNKDKNTSP